MPTGTKIAAIVLVVLLGAAGLYYAFVPPTPATKPASSGGTGIGATDTGALGSRPSTLPPAGASGTTLGTTSGTGLSAPGSTVTTPGLDELMERNRQQQAAAATSNGGANGLAAGSNTAVGAPSGGTAPQGASRSFSNGGLGSSTTSASGATTGSGLGTGTPTGATGNTATSTTGGFGPNGLTSASGGSSTTGTGTGSASTTTNGGTGSATSSNTGSNTVSNTGASTGSTPRSTTTASNTASNTAGSSSGSTYLVQKGDTMQTIAKSQLGSTNKWQLIAKANPTVDPTRMKIGTKLVIPAVNGTVSGETTIASTGSTGSSASTKTASSSNTRGTGNTATASASGGTHTVAKGETLSSIAKKYYGDSKLWKSIASANPKINPNSLAVGDKLTIPAKSVVVSGGNVER